VQGFTNIFQKIRALMFKPKPN